MLPLCVLCDARKLCCTKYCQHMNQRDFKLHYLTSADLSHQLQGEYWSKKERFIINAFEHRYTPIAFEDVVYSYTNVFVYLIQTKRVSIAMCHALNAQLFYCINDSKLYKIVKAFAQQGLQIRDIFPSKNFMMYISRMGVKTTKLLFRMGLHINDIPKYFPGGLMSSASSILENAINHDCFTIVKILYDQGMSVEDFRSKHNHALFVASNYGNLRIVKFLIHKVGLTLADIRSRENGALWNAGKNGHLNVVAFLFEQGLGVIDLAVIPKIHAHIVDYVRTQTERLDIDTQTS